MSTSKLPGDVFGKNGRTFHVCLSVRGTLNASSDRELAGLFRLDGGRKCTAEEAREHLYECLAHGKEALPFGPPCEGFDYAGKGCPGHDIEELQP